MDKLQLIKHLAELNPHLKIKDADLAVKVLLDAMCGSLAKGGRIEIRGFGTFSLSACTPQQKRNPITGMMKEPIKYIPQFKPAKEMRERVGDSTGAGTADVTPLFPAAHSHSSHVTARNIENVGSHL